MKLLVAWSQYFVAVDGLVTVNVINHILNGNWRGFAAHAVILVKDGITVYLASTINAKVNMEIYRL